MLIQFLGAARTVTGSKHHITTAAGKQILLDCGLVQDKGSHNDKYNRHLGLDPHTLDAVILSHAHIDHSGNLPNLVKQGFRGPIYCTQASIEICAILLEDSAKIQAGDVEYINKKRERDGRDLIKPIYDSEDVRQCLKQMVAVQFNEDFPVCDEVTLHFTDAGHILGSAVVNLLVQEGSYTTRLCFTGDVGRQEDLLLNAPEPFPQADYIICESTYGNRLHPSFVDAEKELLRIVVETCVIRRARLLIPSFSLGRTQEIVYTLDRLRHFGKLPSIPVYVDSPLSVNATDIMRRHKKSFNKEVQKYLQNDEDPFGFNTLHYISKSEDSKKLNRKNDPCIIISSSGMLEAGRIKHHIKHSIGDPASTLLIVGYTPPGSLGRRLLNGDKTVRIFGEAHAVKFKIEELDTFSAHADYQELLAFLSCQKKEEVKTIFLVHGDDEALEQFKVTLLDRGYKHVDIPEPGQIVCIGAPVTIPSKDA